MSTRIYLPSSGTAPVTPSTWNHPYQVATTYTLPGLVTKGTTALTSRTSATGTTSGRTQGVMRYVIGPLSATAIAGTVNLAMMCSESNANANANLSIAVKIITSAGADRSVLLAYVSSDAASSPYELTTTLSTRRAYSVLEARPIALTTQTPTAGDYLVIEIGFRSATTTTRNIVHRHGDNSGSDLADGDGATNDYAPWVDFSQTLPLQRQGRVSWAELETPVSGTRRGQVSWSELEAPNAPRRGEVSWAELETPNAARRGEVSWAELEAPTAPRKGQVSWAELETPDVPPRRGQVSWAELEVPELVATDRKGQVSWAEFEAPLAPRKALVSWAELEAPLAPRRVLNSWAELEVPLSPRKFLASWAELEVPPDPRRMGQVSYAELQVPEKSRLLLSWAEFDAGQGAGPDSNILWRLMHWFRRSH